MLEISQVTDFFDDFKLDFRLACKKIRELTAHYPTNTWINYLDIASDEADINLNKISIPKGNYNTHELLQKIDTNLANKYLSFPNEYGFHYSKIPTVGQEFWGDHYNLIDFQNLVNKYGIELDLSRSPDYWTARERIYGGDMAIGSNHLFLMVYHDPEHILDYPGIGGNGDSSCSGFTGLVENGKSLKHLLRGGGAFEIVGE